MMTCREFVDFLMAYLNDELPAAQRDAFRAHISDCPPCVNFLDTYKITLDLEKEAYREIDCADLPPQLVKAILAAKAEG
ncbi:MAG: anti-sigma factor family protein [Acidobacteriota bacterium]